MAATRSVLLLRVVLLLCLVCCGFCQDSTPTAPMEEAEKKALFAAIGGFVGKGWNGSGLYPDPCGWSPIQGVSCDLFDGLWYVTAINVGPFLDNSLQCGGDARFTSLLFELKHLKTLSFYSCFTGAEGAAATIPNAGWDKLAATLETLEFRSNPGLVGPIPPALGALTSLQSLVVVDNNLTGSPLPAELGALRALRRLVLCRNGLSGEIPPEMLGNVSNLAALLILDAAGNALTGSLPPSVGGLTSLLKLDLSGNSLTGPLPPELAGLKSLTLLDLRNNSLTGGLVRSLQDMAALQDLLLSNNPLGGSLAALDWRRLPNLTTLDLANTGIEGTIPDSLASLKRLDFLALDHNKLVGAVPASLGALPELRAMYLNANNLTGRLEFTASFYERMGRRFASWSNPGLCYAPPAESGHGPEGVEQCNGAEIAGGDQGSKEGEEDNSSINLARSFGELECNRAWWPWLITSILVIYFSMTMMI